MCTGMDNPNYCFKITPSEGTFVPTTDSGAIYKGCLLDKDSKNQIDNGMPRIFYEYTTSQGVISVCFLDGYIKAFLAFKKLVPP